MIDRINFEIRDFDIVQLHKSFKDEFEKRDDVYFNFKLNNMTVKVCSDNLLRFCGSLHKFSKGNNYSVFTYEEAKQTICELSNKLGIPIENFIVTKIELGLNIKVKLDPIKYIEAVKRYKKYSFIPMTPYAKTSKIKGCRCKLSEYEIKLYDKTYEHIRSEKIKVKDRLEIPENILRFEISLSRKQLKNKGFKNVTGKSLQSPLHRRKFQKILSAVVNDIYFDENAIDYSALLSVKEIGWYLFCLSDKYNQYLNCVRDSKGENAYHYEVRKSKMILNKIASCKLNPIENEFREEFIRALSNV